MWIAGESCNNLIDSLTKSSKCFFNENLLSVEICTSCLHVRPSLNLNHDNNEINNSLLSKQCQSFMHLGILPYMLARRGCSLCSDLHNTGKKHCGLPGAFDPKINGMTDSFFSLGSESCSQAGSGGKLQPGGKVTHQEVAAVSKGATSGPVDAV